MAGLDSILQKSGKRQVKAGDAVYHEGDAHGSVYYILSGTVRECVHGQAVRTYQKGEIFGGVSAVDGGRSISAAVAQADCMLLEMPLPDLDEAVREYPEIAAALLGGRRCHAS